MSEEPLCTHAIYDGRPLGIISQWHSVGNELMEIDKHHASIEKLFSDEDKKLQAQVSEYVQKNKLEGDDLDEYVEWHGLDLHQYQSKYPSMQRYATIIMVCNLLEHSLDVACNLIAAYKGMQISLSDFQGKGVRRARIYLKKALNIDTDTLNEDWKLIYKIFSLRNIIVHKGGVLESDDAISDIYVGESNLLRARAGSQLIILNGFIPELIESCKGFQKRMDSLIMKELTVK